MAGGAGKPLPHYGKTAACAASASWGKLLHMKKRRSSPLFERKPAVFGRKSTDSPHPGRVSAHSCHHSQRRSAAVLGSSSVQFYCPRATRLSPYVCGLPSQEYTPNGGFSSTQLSLLRSHSCAHSAVRGGFFAPFLQNCRLTKLVFTACSHTTSPDPIQLSSFYLMGKSTGSQKFCFADVLLSLSDISIKRWLSVVNSNFQNSSFPSQTPASLWDATDRGSLPLLLLMLLA